MWDNLKTDSAKLYDESELIIMKKELERLTLQLKLLSELENDIWIKKTALLDKIRRLPL